MLAKSTRRSPWLVGICAEVARHRSLIALRAAPRRGSSHKTPALTARGSLSYYSLIWAGYTRGVAPQGPEYILASDSFTPAPLSLTPKHFLKLPLLPVSQRRRWIGTRLGSTGNVALRAHNYSSLDEGA